MKLDALFNWPLGKNSARISLGSVSVDDVHKEFSVGLTPKGKTDAEMGAHPAGWVVGDKINDQFTFDVERGDKVTVFSRALGAKKAESKVVIDTDLEWPAEAHGGTSINTGWTF